MSSGLVPRDGTREHEPMLGGRSSVDSDVESRPSDTLLSSSADFDEKAAYRRPAGRRSFKWILGLTCLSMLLLFGLIFLQFFNVQSKAAPPEEAHGEEDNHAGEQQQQDEPIPTPEPELVAEVTPTIVATTSLVPTQTPEVKLTPEQQFDLKTGFEVSNATTLREYVFNITRQSHSPDGFEKSMILINGQSPGPLIEANTGDTIIHDPDEKIPAVDDDKILMVGDLFHEYGGNLLNQYLSATPPWAPTKPGREPPPDNVIINGKNTFNCSSIAEHNAGTDKTGDKGSGEHNMADMDMDMTDMKDHDGHKMGGHSSKRDDSSKCTWGTLHNTRVKSGSKSRLRLINHGTSTPIFVTVDNHTMDIVEIDGVEVNPIATTRVYMNPGQRYSVIVNANQTAGNYLIRADAAVRCFHMSHKNHKSGMHGAPFGATAILSYDETEISVPPMGQAWNLKATSSPGIGKEPWGSHCEDLPFNLPKPMRKRTAYIPGDRNFHYFTFRQDKVGDVVRTHVNDTLFTPLKDDATLWKVMGQDMSLENLNSPTPKLDFGKDQFVLYSKDDKAAQIVVNSDAMMVHPWHLHGQNFQIVGWGHGLFGQSGTTWNFDNPMRRDTVTIPGFSHIVIRILADNPGVWAFHCHYLWHAEAGMFVSIAQRMGELGTLLGSLDAAGNAEAIKKKFCPTPNPPAAPAASTQTANPIQVGRA
ncbi:hypothetical protein COL940_014331 [Colletotrichum noveboracense]|nr:hypothetical protein COL940_014331 [Colletotrichum noveboracense]KAJ0269371.1 hypothetical protein CBS470a_013752 [Colletotrichum nupharicola]